MRISSFCSFFAASAVCAGLLAVSSTSANAVIINYDASAALDVDDDPTMHDHALWIPGLGFVVNDFDSNGGIFSENTATGTASLTGTAVDSLGNGFIIDAMFSGFVGNTLPDDIADAPGGSPKDEGHSADAGNWRYYTSTSGTITGVGGFAGQEFTLTRMGPSFQVGNGASGKNDGFGASGWLTITEVLPAGSTATPRVYTGDFNIDLGEGSTVPDTGTTLLLMGLGLGLIRRFKRS
jgi:hypothetical protein